MKKTYTFSEIELKAVQLALKTQLATLDAIRQHADMDLPKTRKVLEDLSLKLLPF